MSIRIKILLPMVAAAVICAAIIGMLAVYVVHTFVEDFNEQQLDKAQTLASTLLEQHREDAARASAMGAESERLIETLRDYIAGNDREPFVNESIALMTSTGVDFLTVLDTEGNVLVRAHEPDNFGDSLANQANVKAAISGSQYTTTEKGSAVKLSVRSGTPIRDENGAIIGVLSLGYRLDQSEFVDYVKRMTGTEVTVFLGDTRVSTTILTENGERAIDTKASEHITSQVLEGNDYAGVASVLGKDLYSHYSPIRDAENAVLGMLFVGMDTSDTDNRMLQDTWIMVGVVIVLGLISVVVSLKISNRIARPIHAMSDTAERLAEGDIDVDINIKRNPSSKDETIHLAMAFSDMIRVNRERAMLIREVAQGNLSGDIHPKSERDVVGVALGTLLERTNAAFSKMSRVATHLDVVSTQVANGAQDLAQGASEQSATIDRLCGALEELSSETTEKAGQARQAAALSESVKRSAEEGSRRMDQMIEAVAEISRASESISKVMKVIDDIAFQTNILALNAAVEAARAGQYGKGFAVVAEEVRNLAAKSAEAAKDTSELIANSIERAKVGADISAETASAFASIVGGVNETSVIVKELAEFMQTQNHEIDGITSGVESINTVVNSISASAEESAASSEEMSAQAAVMSEIVARYTLRPEQTTESENPN